MEVELLVPSSAIGFVDRGQQVTLQYKAFPFQKFGVQRGSVSYVSRRALSPAEASEVSGIEGISEPVFRVRVRDIAQEIHGRPVRPSMLVDADVLLERRRIIEWIFSPIYAAKGRLSGQEGAGESK